MLRLAFVVPIHTSKTPKGNPWERQQGTWGKGIVTLDPAAGDATEEEGADDLEAAEDTALMGAKNAPARPGSRRSLLL